MIVRLANGGSFRLRWEGEGGVVRSTWAGLDDLLLVRAKLGGEVEGSAPLDKGSRRCALVFNAEGIRMYAYTSSMTTLMWFRDKVYLAMSDSVLSHNRIIMAELRSARVLNLTPHTVTFKRPGGLADLVYEPNSMFGPNGIRADWTSSGEGECMEGVPVWLNGPYKLGSIDASELEDGDILIVSMLVGQGVEKLYREEFNALFQGKKLRFVSPGSGPGQCERVAGAITKSLLFIEYVPHE